MTSALLCRLTRAVRPRFRRRPGAVTGRSGPLACAILWLLMAIPIASAESPQRVLRLQSLSIEDGLSQATANCILQDRDGFLWIGTQSGLNRYDGYGIKVFRQGIGELSHDWVTSLALGADGLWIGTKGGGLNFWSETDNQLAWFRHRPEDDNSLSSDRIWTLWTDRNDNLWIGTAESGLNRLDPSRQRLTRYRADPDHPHRLVDDRVRSIVEDDDGRLWIGTFGGLSLFDPQTERFETQPLGDDAEAGLEIRALLMDRHGKLWVGTQQGLIRLDPESRQLQTFERGQDPDGLSHNWIRSLYQDHRDRLWVGTDGGLNLIETGPDGAPVSIESPSGIGTDQVVAITEDRSGNVWLGTVGEGLRKWNPRSVSFRHYRDDDSEAGHNNIFAISTDANGGLWTGTFGGGIARIDRESLQRQRFRNDPDDPTSLSEDRVTTLLHDSEGTLWAGTVAGGLNQRPVDGDGFRRHRRRAEVPDSLSSDSVTTLFEDSRGQLWVGTFGGGLNRYLGDDRFLSFVHQVDDPRSLSNDRVLALAEAADGGLWIATDGGGLNHLAADEGGVRHFRHDDEAPLSLSSDELLSLHRDRMGRLWIGTKSNGLDLLEDTEAGGRFRNYRGSGLLDSTLWGIESDAQNRLWLSTNQGLVRFDPGTLEFRAYDTGDGLQSLEFNLGAHYKSSDGELFFGGVNGVNAFVPREIRDNSVAPNVVLTDFRVLNQPVDLGIPLAAVRSMELDHSDHFLSLEFAALDFTAPEKNQYRYQLKGFEQSWVPMTDRQVQFTSLSPGSYTLRVQGSNSDGVWSHQEATIDMIVAPPLWLTWWFRSLLLLFAAATVTLAHQLKVRRIRYNNERLQVLVRERTQKLEEAQERLLRKEKLAVLGELSGSVAHELRNPLGIIKNSVFFLRLTQKLVDPKAQEHLALIEEEIQRSDRIISELLDYAKEPQAQTQSVAITAVINDALKQVEVPEAVRLQYEPESFVDTDGQPWRSEIDPGQIQRVLTNLLSNGIQAMPEGGTLGIDGGIEGAELWLRVRDTGVGIEEDDLEKVFEPLFTRKIYGIGLGLPLSLRYVQMNQGRLECQSRPGEGTTFHLYLPLASRDSSS